MIQNIIFLVLFLTIALPIGIFFITEFGSRAKRFKFTLLMNIASFFGVLLFATVFLFSGAAFAETASSSTDLTDQGLKFIAAALSTGFATIGAGVATGSAASAALGALSENDSIMGRALIFVALSEGIAIYGLLVSFMILNK
ncbi:MAG: ATP synthase subunit C [Clostridiales bacterium]|jgi:V/A-type H+-transporting ATPase subunit K|nr:ATP synthase subunit C [Clostridiales bacterium]